MTGRPGGLGIGDRVRFSGRDQVVIGVSGTLVRMADTAGEVTAVTVSALLAGGDFAVLGARPRPGMPQVSVLGELPSEAVDEARWWERHIVEVLTGVPPDAEEGTVPRPEYDPGTVTLTRREQAKAAELTAAGHPVTASAVAKQRGGVTRSRACPAWSITGPGGGCRRTAGPARPLSRPCGRRSARPRKIRRGRRRSCSAGPGRSLRKKTGTGRRRCRRRRTLYRLFARLEAGRHTTGSARTRRSLAARPDGPFGQVPAAAPGDVMQIDSTPLDVLVRLDNGVTGRVDLTGNHRRRDQDGDRGGAAADDEVGGRERAAGPDRDPGADAAGLAAGHADGGVCPAVPAAAQHR